MHSNPPITSNETSLGSVSQTNQPVDSDESWSDFFKKYPLESSLMIVLPFMFGIGLTCLWNKYTLFNTDGDTENSSSSSSDWNLIELEMGPSTT